MTDPVTMMLEGADRIAIAADIHGDAASDPVILLHGGGQTRHAWGGTALRLAERGYHVLSLDHRGHGDSGWAKDGRYELSAFRDDLEMILAGFDRPAILVGASLGGIAALLVAGEKARHRVRALVLVDITPTPQQDGTDHIMAFMMASPDGFADVEEAADAVALYLPHRPRPRDPSGLMKNLRARDGRLYWHWDPRFIQSAADTMDTERLIRCSRGVSVPTLLVRGEDSDIVAVSDADAFVALIPGARVVHVPGATHMVAGDRNSIFSSAVLDFLADVAPPSDRS